MSDDTVPLIGPGSLADVAPVGLWEDRFWFARRARGLGASPVTWKGWLATLGFVFGMIAVDAVGLVILVTGMAPQWIAVVLMAASPLALLTALILVMNRRTDWSITRADYLLGKRGVS